METAVEAQATLRTATRVCPGWGGLVAATQGRVNPPRHLNFVGQGNFEATGDEFLRYFIDCGGLKPGDQVLEIGSGIGRMARPLTKYLTSGHYHGIDIVPKGIGWCERNISSRYPRLHFHLADIHNLAYNPGGRLKPVEYRFPFKGNTFDFALLTSVFSHMITADMKHYLDPTALCLRPDGKCLITFFLVNRESRQLISEGKSPLTFQFRRDGCYVNDDLVPEYAVAYSEDDVRLLFHEAGLEVDALHYGAWCGRSNFVSYQDIVIARKIRSDPKL
jgi:SAM-dependent methyltransferase